MPSLGSHGLSKQEQTKNESYKSFVIPQKKPSRCPAGWFKILIQLERRLFFHWVKILKERFFRTDGLGFSSDTLVFLWILDLVLQDLDRGFSFGSGSGSSLGLGFGLLDFGLVFGFSGLWILSRTLDLIGLDLDFVSDNTKMLSINALL